MVHLSGEWILSDLCKGLALLHEGLHAYDRLVRRRHMPKPFGEGSAMPACWSIAYCAASVAVALRAIWMNYCLECRLNMHGNSQLSDLSFRLDPAWMTPH
jgi:hypothetical protein